MIITPYFTITITEVKGLTEKNQIVRFEKRPQPHGCQQRHRLIKQVSKISHVSAGRNTGDWWQKYWTRQVQTHIIQIMMLPETKNRVVWVSKKWQRMEETQNAWKHGWEISDKTERIGTITIEKNSSGKQVPTRWYVNKELANFCKILNSVSKGYKRGTDTAYQQNSSPRVHHYAFVKIHLIMNDDGRLIITWQAVPISRTSDKRW